MDAATDRQHIESYLEGDAQAAREIDGWVRKEMEICYPALRREKEDICQAVHGKLLQNLRAGRFQYRSALKTYVGRITHYTAIDFMRRRNRERTVDAEWILETTPSGESPYRAAASLEEQILVDQLMLRSPTPCRELWRLVFVERLSYAEIARKLGIPPGTVKSRMWHCRRKALALLEQLQRKRKRRARRSTNGHPARQRS